MIGYLVLGSGVLLSAIGAYMSIVGLSSIFGGAFMAVVIMGIILELSKTTTAVYLKILWGNQRVIIRSYFIIATVILSVVTSLGVFGFLSRSYSVDTIEYGSNKVVVESLEKQVQLEKNRIASLEKQLEKFEFPPRRITQQIDVSTNQLIELEKKLSTEKQTSTQHSAELLPLVFISEVLFGSDDPQTAIKLLIILLVITMDPLALLLTTVGVSMIRKEAAVEEEPPRKKSEAIAENDVYEIKMEKVL